MNSRVMAWNYLPMKLPRPKQRQNLFSINASFSGGMRFIFMEYLLQKNLKINFSNR